MLNCMKQSLCFLQGNQLALIGVVYILDLVMHLAEVIFSPSTSIAFTHHLQHTHHLLILPITSSIPSSTPSSRSTSHPLDSVNAAPFRRGDNTLPFVLSAHSCSNVRKKCRGCKPANVFIQHVYLIMSPNFYYCI